MDLLKNMCERLEQRYPELVRFRRDLHMYPELSFREVETPKKIAEYLTRLGIGVRTGVGGRGVVGTLKGAKPGKRIALRADFDALPIQDEKEVEYKSRVPGVMHACGHDIHTASLLGAAAVLSEFRHEIAGEVVFIFQFAEEEVPGGAIHMIEDGCLDGVDEIYGAHVWAHLPVGTIGVIPGRAMAAGDRFEIEIIGRGGHGAKPHVTVDALFVGCQLVNSLQSIVSRQVDPLQSAVVTVGTFHAGKAYNVIAGDAVIGGTVRTFDEDVRNAVEASIRKMTDAVCTIYGAQAVVRYERGYPVLENHPEPIRKVEQCAVRLVGEEKVLRPQPSMGMEDFAYYLRKVPGAFFYVGGGNEQIGAVYPHHHPKFDVDESAMLTIGKMFLSLVMNPQ
jgi:amidohydrolase